jgi:DNA-binding response OmpR family regulator
LIVDDNEDLARALELRLRANDYHVLWATDGTSAVTQALTEKPFAILLDLYLPKEDGFAVMQQLQSSPELSSVPVIIVSADCSPATQHKLLDEGAHSFLEKPVNHHLLLDILRDIQLRSKGPDRLRTTTDPNPLQD